MTWPAAPNHHRSEVSPVFQAAGDSMVWREPRVDLTAGDVATFRTCGFCGSIHPADLSAALEQGVASLHGCDWKYGWPHKFYVEGMPNQFEGAECETGAVFRDGVRTPILGKPSKHVFAKWYNGHLLDAGYGAEELAKLLRLIELHSGIAFHIADGGRLGFRAPAPGYQRG